MMMKRGLFASLFAITAVLGCGGGSNNSTPPPPPNPDFTLSVISPTSVTQGSSGNVTVTVSPLNGFTGTVNVTLTASQNGITAAPIQVAAGSSGSLVVAVDASVPAAAHNATVSGTSGSLSHTASLQVTVTAPPITIAVTPTSASVNEGVTQQFTASVVNTVNTAVTWSVNGVIGGNSTVGAIDATGLYAAPAVAPNPATVIVRATSVADTSKSATASVTINWHIGDGAFSETNLVFSDEFGSADRTYITDLFKKVYPLMVSAFGPPPDTAPLAFKLGSWSADANTHTIYVPQLPTAQGFDPNSWNAVWSHELGLLMFLSEHTGMGSNWIAESLGDMGSLVAMRTIGMTGAAYVLNELDYDVWRLAGKEIAAGAPGKAWRQVPSAAALNQAASASVLEFLLTTNSAANVGDWKNYSVFKTVKVAMYEKANTCQCELTDQDFFDALSVLSHPIEGVLPDQWVKQQPTAYTYGTPGVYAYVYASPATNPSWLEVVCFQRLSEDYAPGVRKEIPCTSGSLKVTISNAQSTVKSVTLDLGTSNREIPFSVTGQPLGSYRIAASGTANGSSVTAPDSYVGVFDPSVVPAGQEIGTLASSLFLVAKNADGTPSATLIAAPTGGPAGKFLVNQGGAAIWQIDATKATTIPQPEYTLNGRKLPVPMILSPFYIITQ